jgi:nucleotide-binding universal stress UspA family protein
MTEETPAIINAKGVEGEPVMTESKKEHERRVLIAVDDALGPAIVDWAAEQFLRSNDDVLLCGVRKRPEMVYGPQGTTWPDSIEELEKMRDEEVAKIEKYLLPLAKKLKAEKFNVGIVVELGEAREVIIDSASHFDSDVILVGCRDRGMIKRALLGSVSSHVVHHAPVPVIVVRHPEDVHHEGKAPQERHELHHIDESESLTLVQNEPARHEEGRTILLALDGSDVAKAAFEWAAANVIRKEDRVLLATARDPSQLHAGAFFTVILLSLFSMSSCDVRP